MGFLKKGKKFSQILTVVVMGILAVGLPTSVKLVKRSQENRSKASPVKEENYKIEELVIEDKEKNKLSNNDIDYLDKEERNELNGEKSEEKELGFIESVKEFFGRIITKIFGS